MDIKKDHRYWITLPTFTDLSDAQLTKQGSEISQKSKKSFELLRLRLTEAPVTKRRAEEAPGKLPHRRYEKPFFKRYASRATGG